MMIRGVQPVIEYSATSTQVASSVSINSALEISAHADSTGELQYSKAALRAAEQTVRDAVAGHDSCVFLLKMAEILHTAKALAILLMCALSCCEETVSIMKRKHERTIICRQRVTKGGC